MNDISKNKSITIVAVSDLKIKETINALLKSSKSLNPKKTILFSSKNLKLNKKEREVIDLINIKPISSIREYSNFIIFSLHLYINTSHVLIVQWDGYIYNKNKWSKNFLNFDYIGAPFIPRVNDKNYSRDFKNRFYVIGNGGFSLRSKSLLEAPSKYKLRDNESMTNFHEDGFFSIYHREFLESKGFVWAPFKIAKEFSIESPLSFEDLFILPFGFHGKKMLLVAKIMNTLKNILNFLKIIRLTVKKFF